MRAPCQSSKLAAPEVARAGPVPRAAPPERRPLFAQLGNRALGALLQAKLAVSEPGDPLEQVADRVADQVMTMPDPAAAPIQRKCAECAHEDEERVDRKPVSTGTPVPSRAPAPSTVAVLGSGQSLSPDARRFFEPRFGNDFGGVRVHTDARSTRSARAVQARAYTVGRDIVFRADEYSPETSEGRRLLAHELAHTIQQSASGAPAIVQRAVSPGFSRIRDNLTYGIFDWAITDAEAHELLMILKPLSDDDMRDTVAAIEAEGLVDRLFDNASEDDRSAEAETLQRVQNFRVYRRSATSGATTVTLMAVGSCSPEQAVILNGAIGTALGWLNTAINRLNTFVALPISRSTQDVARALRTHFHTQYVFHAELIRDRLAAIQREATSRTDFVSECAAPTDPLCSALAAAYVRPGTPSPVGVRWCPGFFTASEEWRAEATVHESAHAFARRVGWEGFAEDRGYFGERIYAFLRTQEAMSNADSYAMLTQELVKGPQTPEQAGRPSDRIEDCPPGAPDMVRPALARAARWNLNALNVLADPDPAMQTDNAHLRRRHFDTDDPARIRELVEVFQKARQEFERNIPWECETAGGVCSGSVIGYYRYFLFITSSVLHLCPSWFAQGEQQRIESLYALVLSHDADVREADRMKFVGLARDLTERYWPTPPPVPTEPFPTSTTPGTEIV